MNHHANKLQREADLVDIVPENVAVVLYAEMIAMNTLVMV
jgi:hypothetical protein